MFSFSQKNYFVFGKVYVNVKFITLLCSNYIHFIFVYDVQPSYIHTTFKKYQKHVKIIFIRD